MPDTIDANVEEQQETAKAQEYAPGELAAGIVTQAQVWKPDDLNKADKTLIGTLTELVNTCSISDEAARRFSVLHTWENRHMDRGYQYLEGENNGGWKIAGTGAGKGKNSLAAADDANLYPTNVLSAQGDIITSALCRGAIKVSFAPRQSKDPQSAAAADEKNKYKHIWGKVNNQTELQRELMGLGWTDCRALGWTRSVADKTRFGTNTDGSPKVCELSTIHGILETKLPMMVDRLDQCGYAQIFEEVDYAVARAAYPWMGNKIKPSWGTYGELEFERIARINTRIGIIGKYITGTSGIREATMGYMWFRPGMFFGDSIQPTQREFLLSNFSDGMFLIMAGSEVVCCWNESMDDHLVLGMYARGFGQNRRSLGSSDVPIQKRINIWADLWDKFVRTAIPMTLLDSDAFNAEAIQQLEANPARFVSVAVNEGQTMDSVVGQTPAPQPIPGMAEMFQWYVGPLIQSIDGGTPALFGSGEGADNTVGATQIRLQQALERMGTAWIMANHLFARMVSQAASCCGENAPEEIVDMVPGVGDLQINPALLKGKDNYCFAETINGIPESGAQRESKLLEILNLAQQNNQIAAVVGTPSNAREIVRAFHIDDIISIDEADSEDKQLEEIEELLLSEPHINPDYQQLSQELEHATQVHEVAKSAATQAVQSGQQVPDQAFDQGEQMEQGIQQLQQQLQSTPQYLSSVPVAQDESEDHATEAATCFSWMQEPDGRSIRKAATKESPGGPHWNKWQNVFLHWKAHKDMAAKIAADNQQGTPVKASINIDPSKLTGEAQASALQRAGIQANPQGDEVEQETMEYTPVSEVKTKVKRRL